MENPAIKSSFLSFVLEDSLSAKSCKWILVLFVSLLISMTILPDSIYIRSYPQDIFGLLDGIHRTVRGQIAHRDFSAKMGILVYALPAWFVRFGVDPVLSLAYAQASLLILNLIVVLHLLNTRISGIVGLLFALWTSLMLAARMNLGESVQDVTFAMYYNRYCTVFLSEMLLCFIPPKYPQATNEIIDVVLMSLLTLILFYSKITYGVVALVTLALLVLTPRANAKHVTAAMLLTLIAAIGLEARYRFHRAYFSELVMVLQSSGLSRGEESFINYKAILALVLTNLPELVLCIALPVLILWRKKALTRSDAMIFLFVAGVSVALLSQNPQSLVLALPFSALLIALDICDRRAGPDRRQVPSKGFICAIIIWTWFLCSYPLVLNCVFSFARSISGGTPIGTERSLRRFVVDWRNHQPSDPELVGDIIRGNASGLDLFERARVSTPRLAGMLLSEAEYAVSLEDGFRAARDGCGEGARILTADQVNPFPAVLDLPVGGGMIWLDERAFSVRAHPAPDSMLRNITCVMVPRLPIAYRCRELFWSLYGEYVKSSFRVRRKTNYWIVYRLKSEHPSAPSEARLTPVPTRSSRANAPPRRTGYGEPR